MNNNNNNTARAVNDSLQRPETDLLLSLEQRRQGEDVLLVLRYVAVALCLPSTFCNIAVFLHKDMRGATAVYVIAISVAQCIYVMLTTLLNVFYETLEDPRTNGFYLKFYMYVTVFVGILFKRGSYVVMCLVSLERLYAIARPLHVKTFLLHRRPVVSVVATYSFAALLHVYILTRNEIKAFGTTPSGRVLYRAVPTSLYLQHRSVNDAFSAAAKVILTYLALLVQIGLNVMTVIFLKRHNMAAKDVCSSAKEEQKRGQERQMTLTILVATVSYVVLSLPSVVHNFVSSLFSRYYGLYGIYNNMYVLMSGFSLVLSLLSYCVDFVCFVSLSSKYRQTLAKLCGHVSERRADSNHVQ